MAKGEQAEELLRRYFAQLGYYVARGLVFSYGGFDVTDIDLWLYNRFSQFSRERINVDVKNKKTPQAIERIFWARGLQHVLGLDSCVVATTDRRNTVVEFGRENGVLVLTGSFLEHLRGRTEGEAGISEEELFETVDDGASGASDRWRPKLQEAKNRLLNALNFDGCNQWLKDIEFFAAAAVADPHRRQGALRALYSIISQFLIALDFTISRFGVVTAEERRRIIVDGIRFGSQGPKGARAVAEMVGRAADRNSAEFEHGLLDLALTIPADILADHFSRTAIAERLFEEASGFSALAYSIKLKSPAELPTTLKGTFAALLDFTGIERKQLL